MPPKVVLRKRGVTHDPVTGAELPAYVSFVPPNKHRRKTAVYRLKVPEAHCREQGVSSKSAGFATLAELLASDLYRKVSEDSVRLYREGTMKPWRTEAHKEASVCEYDRLISEGTEIHPDIHFRHSGATWAITRTFGTGWTFRATTHSYEDAVLLQRECVNLRNVAEVVGDATTEARKHKKMSFSRKMLMRLHAEESPREDDEEAGEEVEVEVVEEDEEDEDEDEDEEVEVVDGNTFRSSRSGRACKRPNLYSKETARPQQGKRRVARTEVVVGKPVLAVVVEKERPSASGSTEATIPVYDSSLVSRVIIRRRRGVCGLASIAHRLLRATDVGGRVVADLKASSEFSILDPSLP